MSSLQVQISRHGQLLLTTIRFLTIIPLPARWTESEHSQQQPVGELLYYPVVGLLIGLVLMLVEHLTAGISAWVSAAIVLSGWVLLTGALHLDGLADSADAMLGGHGDRDRTLSIMKDTHCGVAAVVTLCLLLMLKLVCLHEMVQQQTAVLLLAPVLARMSAVALLLTTGYVRDNGIASVCTSSFTPGTLWGAMGIILLLMIVTMPRQAMMTIAMVILVFWWLRSIMVRRLGGTTGDTAGAMVELTEMTVLLSFVFSG